MIVSLPRVPRHTALSLAALITAMAVTAPLAAQAATALTSRQLESARSNYVSICGRCHGVDGLGGEGPPLAIPELHRAPDDATLIQIISLGIPGTAMNGTRWLLPDELTELAAYVRSLAPRSGSATVTGDASRGRELYERGRCDGCHTVGGFGTARGPDLTSVGTRRGATYLREALLEPEAALPRGLTQIPLGFADYLMVRVVDERGTEVRGMRMNEDTYTIQIKDARGVIHSFYKPSLRELDKQFDRSLMRSYRDAFTDPEVDDLVSYLMSLTGSTARLVS
ncbi:MAG: c-type cytochrome [Gemmatimonadetes bacterium]|nr:c-type cytochrome [Gemmatimonadota bacterium]